MEDIVNAVGSFIAKGRDYVTNELFPVKYL
jgi:hypothetical protein